MRISPHEVKSQISNTTDIFLGPTRQKTHENCTLDETAELIASQGSLLSSFLKCAAGFKNKLNYKQNLYIQLYVNLFGKLEPVWNKLLDFKAKFPQDSFHISLLFYLSFILILFCFKNASSK